MVEILIDRREDKSLIMAFLKSKLDVKIKQLEIADIIIYGEDYNKKPISIGIERKTQSDFLNSIIDKRLIKQLIDLKNNFSLQLLILEGQENIYRIRNFHPNAIRGMLSSIALDLQIPILQTKGVKDTLALVQTIIKRLEKPRKDISLLTKRKPITLKEQQEYIIESFPGIGPSLAKAILKKFESIENFLIASEEELMSVEKIGKKKASEIKKLIGAKYL